MPLGALIPAYMLLTCAIPNQPEDPVATCNDEPVNKDPFLASLKEVQTPDNSWLALWLFGTYTVQF